jgi:putative transcriptional regulator
MDFCNEQKGYLSGKILISMPFVCDSRFAQKVIYICGHDDKGAIGLVVNKSLDNFSFQDLLQQLDIKANYLGKKVHMHCGGSVEVNRGFVLHSNDYSSESTIMVDENFFITSTLDILRNIAQGTGPQKYLLALGYVGWSEGQLEQEIQDNTWIISQPSEEILFNCSIELKWKSAFLQIGIDPSLISLDFGRA